MCALVRRRPYFVAGAAPVLGYIANNDYWRRQATRLLRTLVKRYGPEVYTWGKRKVQKKITDYLKKEKRPKKEMGEAMDTDANTITEGHKVGKNDYMQDEIGKLDMYSSKVDYAGKKRKKSGKSKKSKKEKAFKKKVKKIVETQYNPWWKYKTSTNAGVGPNVDEYQHWHIVPFYTSTELFKLLGYGMETIVAGSKEAGGVWSAVPFRNLTNVDGDIEKFEFNQLRLKGVHYKFDIQVWGQINTGYPLELKVFYLEAKKKYNDAPDTIFAANLNAADVQISSDSHGMNIVYNTAEWPTPWDHNKFCEIWKITREETHLCTDDKGFIRLEGFFKPSKKVTRHTIRNADNNIVIPGVTHAVMFCIRSTNYGKCTEGKMRVNYTLHTDQWCSFDGLSDKNDFTIKGT